MDCRELDKFLQVYLDGELDPEDSEALERHLRSCPRCQARADYEARFVKAIKVRVPKPVAPDSFRERLAAAVARESEPRPVARRLMWGSIPAAAALAMVITFTWTVTSGFTPLVREAVNQHSLAPAVDVNASDMATVEDWFRKKVDFNVALPRFRSRSFNLVGARLSKLAERRAALIRYQRSGHRFSLFVVTDSGGDLAGQRCERVGSKEFCLTEQKGYTVAQWRSRGLVYSLVGDATPQEMIEVLSSNLSFP